jgi:hypothetical protein
LGFGGIGGAAITTANVTVVTGPAGHRAVYFGSRLAYVISNPNDAFLRDLRGNAMADVAEAKGRYERRDTVS